MRAGRGATFTSADASGLIYDAITVAPTSLAARGPTGRTT